MQFGFVIFWQKIISAKAAQKMLVKLTARLLMTSFSQRRLNTKRGPRLILNGCL